MAGSTFLLVFRLFRVRACRLEALSVDDGRSRLVVLLLTDPHLLEGAQTGENGASDPDRVLSLGWRDDLDLHRGRSEVADLLLHAVGDARVHGGTAREHSVRVQVLSDVDVALMIELYVVSWMPAASIPRKLGWKRASGQRNR